MARKLTQNEGGWQGIRCPGAHGFIVRARRGMIFFLSSDGLQNPSSDRGGHFAAIAAGSKENKNHHVTVEVEGEKPNEPEF
jgi:hypothetical protein